MKGLHYPLSRVTNSSQNKRKPCQYKTVRIAEKLSGKRKKKNNNNKIQKQKMNNKLQQEHNHNYELQTEANWGKSAAKTIHLSFCSGSPFCKNLKNISATITIPEITKVIKENCTYIAHSSL